jgi:EAL domain-containing protein (putative c-di-GMP-specific phosphodiesterase class I)
MDLGCHCVQGFLFAEPMDSVSFVEMLARRTTGSKPQAGDAASRKLQA